MRIYIIEAWQDYEACRVVSVHQTLEGARIALDRYINSDDQAWRKTCEGFGPFTLQSDGGWRSGCDNLMIMSYDLQP